MEFYFKEENKKELSFCEENKKALPILPFHSSPPLL